MSLKQEKRKTYIQELLRKEGSVSTEDLIKKFGVSKETVRRTLDEMEADGLLTKVYGGAIVSNCAGIEPAFTTRERTHLAEKQAIASKAATIIESHDSIFIDEGTTPSLIIPYLTELRDLRILTNSLSVYAEIQRLYNGSVIGSENLGLILIGGDVDLANQRTLGGQTLEQLKRYNVSKALMSADGVDLDGGVSCISSEKAEFSRACMQIAETTLLLVDNSKVGVRSLGRYADISDFDYIICDQLIPEEWAVLSEPQDCEWISVGTSK